VKVPRRFLLTPPRGQKDLFSAGKRSGGVFIS